MSYLDDKANLKYYEDSIELLKKDNKTLRPNDPRRIENNASISEYQKLAKTISERMKNATRTIGNE